MARCPFPDTHFFGSAQIELGKRIDVVNLFRGLPQFSLFLNEMRTDSRPIAGAMPAAYGTTIETRVME